MEKKSIDMIIINSELLKKHYMNHRLENCVA